MTLPEAIRQFVERKRAEGVEYRCEFALQALSRQVGPTSLERVTARHIEAFLSGPRTSPITWDKKYRQLKAFFDYWLARGELVVLPLPARRKTSPRIFIPYIYTHREIRSLLKATGESQKRAECHIEPFTLKTFLLFLYGTGALVGEAERLRVEDINLQRRTITIRSKSFDRHRTIPIGSDLRDVLSRYMQWRRLKHTNDPHFFISKRGECLNMHVVSTTFLRLRRASGIVRNDGARFQPRMHDLRHTFAVHRITQWIRQGEDLNRLLPALAAYIGQSGLGSTERYLSLTPERFRTQLSTLSPKRGKTRWRDDPTLMKFLAEL